MSRTLKRRSFITPASFHITPESSSAIVTSGRPVVMVHGNPTWSFYYRNLVEALSDQYRTIALDQIGCGLSDKPDDSSYAYTLESRVDDLEALLDHLEVDRGITLVVHDWGGMIGMAFAAAGLAATTWM